jgi:hypothetical protein
VLHELVDDVDAGRPHQLACFGELVLLVDGRWQDRDEEAPFGSGAWCRVGLVRSHGWKYAT